MRFSVLAASILSAAAFVAATDDLTMTSTRTVVRVTTELRVQSSSSSTVTETATAIATGTGTTVVPSSSASGTGTGLPSASASFPATPSNFDGAGAINTAAWASTGFVAAIAAMLAL